MDQATDYTLLGASGGASPPALPIKQRRSKSSSSSIQDLDLKVGDLLLSGPQTPVSPFAEVFTPTYCNAAHCPIHHRYENHQARFFSDQTPPPVPKKSLKRTLSLPAEALDPSYHDHTGTFYENPLYMIAPFHGTLTLKEEEVQEELHQGPSLHRVNFDTPDEQLQRVLRSFQSHEQVSMGIQECYLQFLKNTLQNIESSIFLNEQEMEMAKTSQPNDFILCDEQWTERDAFYLVRCSKIPGRLFSAKVHREDLVSDCAISMLHPNIEQGVVHFPHNTATDQTSTLQHAEKTSEPSHGDTTEVCQQQTVADLLRKDFSVTVVRDFPLGTLEDFVEEGHSLHSSLPEVYERRLCLLVLQLVLGLQQLGHFKVINRELKPQSATLVWPHITSKGADTWEYPSKMKKVRDMNTDTSKGTPRITVTEELIHKSEICQTSWEKWGTPRLVLKSHFEDKVFQEATSQEFQLGTLLRYCLHLTDGCSSVSKVPQDTPYTPGLLWLVTQLTSEKPGLLLADVVGVLQALLWGPRKRLFQQSQLESSVFSNWLLLKRSLLVLKLAEKGLFQAQYGLDWEDYLCLQYLSLTDPKTMLSITERMGLHDFFKPA
ncbi:inactive tyrosine-protein kinase PRAG1 isoform X1 [Siphateles boraxobius]|uniref:inactive tyrosine-protein kinase PRAG1 isoform X1 n=1 Tax=Siphateles boraxobius TaxID=180520 RepID=UPI004063B6A8